MTHALEKRPVLILGGGLAGVSTAFHLPRRNSLIIEKESEVGGTARSFEIDGFTFDITGHLLHLHTPYTKKLIRKLLKNQFFSCVRKALIYSQGTYTRYPFQAATNGLPSTTVDDCVLGFFETYLKSQKNPMKNGGQHNFRSWCLRTFGAGISKYFMIPYNEKLYQTPANRMSADWCGPFVPMPRLADVIQGAINNQDKSFGYNTTFLYPKKGGIQQLARALAKPVKDIRLNSSVQKIDWKRKIATLSSGETVLYSSLVNTIPLLELLKRMEPLPKRVRAASRQLRFASVLCVNIGVKRPRISDASWIYFPEKKYPFYRVGFPMNFTPHVVPKGCSSMYVEVPVNLKHRFSKASLLKQVRAGLTDAGILRNSDKLPVVQFIPIKYAYVIYNEARQRALRVIFSFLSQHGIQSIGRYGEWKYSFMEEAILDGKKAAAYILNGSHANAR